MFRGPFNLHKIWSSEPPHQLPVLCDKSVLGCSLLSVSLFVYASPNFTEQESVADIEYGSIDHSPGCLLSASGALRQTASLWSHLHLKIENNYCLSESEELCHLSALQNDISEGRRCLRVFCVDVYVCMYSVQTGFVCTCLCACACV